MADASIVFYTVPVWDGEMLIPISAALLPLQVIQQTVRRPAL